MAALATTLICRSSGQPPTSIRGIEREEVTAGHNKRLIILNSCIFLGNRLSYTFTTLSQNHPFLELHKPDK